MSDEESGGYFKPPDLMNYDGKTLTGSYGCRADLAKEHMYDTAGQNMKKAASPWKAAECSHHTTSRPTAELVQTCCSATLTLPEKQANHSRSAAERIFAHHEKTVLRLDARIFEVDNRMRADEFIKIEYLKNAL